MKAGCLVLYLSFVQFFGVFFALLDNKSVCMFEDLVQLGSTLALKACGALQCNWCAN